MLTTREFVDKYGLMAKKALGQNFLLDGNITDKIVRMSLEAQNKHDFSGEEVVEVGPGPGGLTRSVLAYHPRRLSVIEMDERCLQILEEIKTDYPQLSIVNDDALRFDWQKKAKEDGKVHVVSNLPYNISVVLLVKWLQQIQNYKSLTLMFQKEVGDRILADVGMKNYGRVSVLAQLQCRVKKLFDLPPTCFVPAPQIWSSVLLFLPREDSVCAEVLHQVELLTGLAFGQRRKMIRQSLKNVPNILLHLEELGIQPTLRAEDLSPSDYLHIAKRLV